MPCGQNTASMKLLISFHLTIQEVLAKLSKMEQLEQRPPSSNGHLCVSGCVQGTGTQR